MCLGTCSGSGILRLYFEFRRGKICIPERRIFKAQCTISELLHAQKVHRRVPVGKVASIVSHIISMSIVIGHISQIMTKYLSMDILSACSWSSFISLSSGSIDQLKFWQDYLGKLNLKDIFESHNVLFCCCSGSLVAIAT